MANAARRFSPTFVATVTPSSVATRDGKNGKYAVLKSAKIERSNGETLTRTVMAFGQTRDLVSSKLRKGRPVDLAVQYDGGTLRVVGLPEAQAAPQAHEAEEQKAPRQSRSRKQQTLLDACVAAAGFDEHRAYGN